MSVFGGRVMLMPIGFWLWRTKTRPVPVRGQHALPIRSQTPYPLAHAPRQVTRAPGSFLLRLPRGARLRQILHFSPGPRLELRHPLYKLCERFGQRGQGVQARLLSLGPSLLHLLTRLFQIFPIHVALISRPTPFLSNRTLARRALHNVAGQHALPIRNWRPLPPLSLASDQRARLLG